MKCEKILSAVIESHLNRLISAFLKIMLFTCIAGRTIKIQYDLNIFPRYIGYISVVFNEYSKNCVITKSFTYLGHFKKLNYSMFQLIFYVQCGTYIKKIFVLSCQLNDEILKLPNTVAQVVSVTCLFIRYTAVNDILIRISFKNGYFG